MAATVSPLLGRLSLLQLTDSAFPSGRYALSYGLEAYAQAGLLTTPSDSRTLGRLLRDCIRFSVAPADGVALACAHRAVAPDGTIEVDLVVEADERLTAVKLPREAREASTRTGRALLRVAATAFDDALLRDYAALVEQGHRDGNAAVVFGLLSGRLDIPRLEAVAGELYAFSSGWTAAAVRLGLTDHSTAQRLLHSVREETAAAAFATLDRAVPDISACTPLLDVMVMQHEQAEVRLFAS